jgi:hypothetical protein
MHISPDVALGYECKIPAIQNWEARKIVKVLQSRLKLANFCRQSVEDLSRLWLPLRLTRSIPFR